MSRNHEVKSHFGIGDYYLSYKSNGGTLDRLTFGKILKSINKKIADNILEGYTFKMPYRLGFITIAKKKEYIGMKDGVAVTNRPIDFKATRELWKSNEEAKEKHILVRHINKHTNGWIYKIKWANYSALFKNKKFYTLRINRDMKRTLAKKIFNGFSLENNML